MVPSVLVGILRVVREAITLAGMYDLHRFILDNYMYQTNKHGYPIAPVSTTEKVLTPLIFIGLILLCLSIVGFFFDLISPYVLLIVAFISIAIMLIVNDSNYR